MGKGSKKSSKKSVKRGELAPSAIVYHGPILKSLDKENTDTMTTVLLSDSAATASATAINGTFSFYNPSTAVDWSDYSSSYDQYRVLGVELHFVPNASTANFANSYAPIATVVDRDTSTALVSYASADNYASLEMHCLDRPWKRVWHMANVTDAQFFNTQALPSTSGAFKLFASGLSNVTYGRFICYWRVQFMGRGI
jgi:hypothetical protein